MTTRHGRQLGIMLGPGAPNLARDALHQRFHQSAAVAAYAERNGVDAVWVGEGRLTTDAIVPLAVYAARTRFVTLGTAVLPMWTRNLALIAQTFATLDYLAPGRVILGLGAWWDPIARQVGIERHRPLAAMREAVTTVRQLLQMSRVTHRGVAINLEDVELEAHDRTAHHVPIFIGATGRRMLELAGEIADGVILNFLQPPAATRDSVERIKAGAERAGRCIDDIARPQLLYVSMDRVRRRALDEPKPLLAQYLAQQPHITQRSGVDPDLIDRLRTSLTWPATSQELAAAARIIPDDVVTSLTVAGTPDDCLAAISRYVDAGCTCPIVNGEKHVIDVLVREF